METKKLGNFCKLRQGFQVPLPDQETELKDGYVRFIRIVDYTQETYDIRYVKDSEKFYYVEPDDVVMVRYGAAGEVGHGISGVIANNMFLIDPLININKDYLYYYLAQNKIRHKLLSSSTSTTMPALNFKIVNDLDVPLYEKDKQDKIVAILDKLSSVIEKRKNEIIAFDELIKARFVELFGRAEDKKYPSVRLGDYAKLQGGYAFKSKDFVDEGVPLVQIGNVNKDYLDWDVVNAVPEEYIDKYSEFALSKDDLVIAMTRPIIKSLDSVKIAKVAEDDLPCLLNQRVGRFQIKDKIHPVFLEILCKTDDFKDYVERMSGNSLQPNISSKQVEDYIIILPPIELQEIFVEFVKQVDKSKVAVQKALDETQTLFDSLMQEYFG